MNQLIISPTFLGKPVPELKDLAQKDTMMLSDAKAPGDETESVKPIHEALADAVADAVAKGKRPAIVMGDCCQTIPILAGLQRHGIKPTLIWLDAHGDFNTWDTTPSGFLGGMPLAMLTGRGEQRMNEQVGLKPLPDDKVILSDGRDLDPGERDLVNASGITHLPQIEALLDARVPAGPLYVHFDSDIIDSGEAPAFHYPVGNGPSSDTVTRVLAHLARTGNVIATSMTAWAPSLDKDGRTRRACLKAWNALNGKG
jgi:arginase